jgi:hypothetical protein
VSSLRIRLFKCVVNFALRFLEKLLEIPTYHLHVLGRESHYVSRILLDDCFGVVLENVGQLIRDNDLFSTVNSLFADVGHTETNIVSYKYIEHISSSVHNRA